jgi:hypothetical protein
MQIPTDNLGEYLQTFLQRWHTACIRNILDLSAIGGTHPLANRRVE